MAFWHISPSSNTPAKEADTEMAFILFQTTHKWKRNNVNRYTVFQTIVKETCDLHQIQPYYRRLHSEGKGDWLMWLRSIWEVFCLRGEPRPSWVLYQPGNICVAYNRLVYEVNPTQVKIPIKMRFTCAAWGMGTRKQQGVCFNRQ